MISIHKNLNWLKLTYYTTPFIICALIIFLFRQKVITSILFLFCGLSATILAREMSDFSGAILLIFSFHLIKSKPYGIVILSTTSIALVLRGMILNATSSQSIVILMAYLYMFLFYYLTFKPFKNSVCNLIYSEDKLILDLLSQGKSQKESSIILGMTQQQINDRIKVMRSQANCISLTQLMYEYGHSQ